MNGKDLGWFGDVRFRDGIVKAEIDRTKVTLGYNIEKVVFVIDKFGWAKQLFLRNGELGVWSFYKKIEYKPSGSDLWVYVYL